MPEFAIYFVVKDWLEVMVNAQNEKNAREAAQKVIDKAEYKNKAIRVVDSNTKFAGITLNDVVNELD